jgi:hypothetical protein
MMRLRRRARAGSDRADSGVGHCGRTRKRNHPPGWPCLGSGRLFRSNSKRHKGMTVIKHPLNSRRRSYGFRGEYLLRGSLTNLALARFRLKIALWSGVLTRRVGRVDCKALFAWVWGGTANPYRSYSTAEQLAKKNPASIDGATGLLLRKMLMKEAPTRGRQAWQVTGWPAPTLLQKWADDTWRALS